MAYHAHYISGTHWDREWYRPFQEFRFLLVYLMDELIELMENSQGFKYFHLDGQTCVLEDYLEVRPEMKPRLARLIEQGRILIGPWYTMPDLFCPGAEALVRNLLEGQRICDEWGVAPMKVAYTCDMFGHPSQMPQIYRGFDMPYCVLGRGTNEHTTPAFFEWRAPDGSSVFCFKLQDKMGYGAFVGSRRVLERQGAGQDAALEEKARASLRSYIDHEIGRTNGDTLCLMDAVDHMLPATDAPRYIRIVEQACPEVKAEHSTLPRFFEEARAKARDVPVKQGELREPARELSRYLWLIPNCVSSRIRMKLANDECQMLLERWAEPFSVIARVEGIDIPERFLTIAWKHVLINHAHDSICGCSIDQVHRDMMPRFDQASILARQIRNRAFGQLTAACADLAQDEHCFTVVVANPVPRERFEVVCFDIELPLDYPAEYQEGFRSQKIKPFTITDSEGSRISYQRLSLIPATQRRSRYAVYASQGDAELTRYTVAAELNLPALGFASFLISPSQTPQRCFGTLRTGPCSAENEHLALSVQPNGTLTLTDKARSETYTDLLLFEDRAEIGDGWFHAESVTTESALSAGGRARVSVVHDGPLLVSFRIAVALDVPARFDWHRQERSEARRELEVVSLVTLRRGARVVDVELTVDNTVQDHCLRLLLPTDATGAQRYCAHHPFDVVERSIARDPATATWEEMELTEKPFLDFQAVCAGQRGLAFLSAGGLHEGGVADDNRRTMQVTLLRSYRRTTGNTEEPDGLEPGKISYRFALMPVSEPLPLPEIFDELSKLKAGIIWRQTGKCPSGYPPMTGSQEPRRSFLKQEKGCLVISAVKREEGGDGILLRLWNPSAEPQEDTFEFWRAISEANLVTLAEKPEKQGAPGNSLRHRGRQLVVTCAPHKILTARVRIT